MKQRFKIVTPEVLDRETKKVLEIRERGIAVLFVEHEMKTVMKLFSFHFPFLC